MFSGVCDMFDGAVAQRCKRNEEEKMFGIQIDSLCDLVAFGALPAVITLRMAENSTLGKIGAAMILLSSVIRLGYFNVQEMNRNRSVPRKTYTGLPVTVAALLFPALLLLNLPIGLSWGIWAPLCLILLAAFEVSKLPVPKPHGNKKYFLLGVGLLLLILLLLFGSSIRI